MKISVAIAAYSGEKYIEQQLLSILNQTRPVDEVVICDDASKDDTAAIVDRFIGAHGLKGWRCIRNEANLGYIENFRKAIDLLAEGEEEKIIFLADQDDYWVKDRVERMVSEMEKRPEIGVLTTRQQTFREPEEPWREEGAVGAAGEPKRIALTPYTRYLRALGCEMALRKSFYDKIKKDWYPGWAHDEFLWSVSVLYGACYDWEYVSLYRRLHEKQVSGHIGHTKQKRVAYLRGVRESSEYLLKMSGDMPEAVQSLFRKNVKASVLRLELIQGRKLLAAVKLLPYLRYYYAPKSYLVELGMALRR